MTNYLYAYRSGVYTNLTDGLQWLANIDGEGLPPITRFKEKGPLQNGVTDLGFRLEARNIALALTVPAYCFERTRAVRQRFLDVFKPGNDAMSLRWDFDDGTSRQIDIFVTGGLPLASKNIGRAAGHATIVEAVQLYAPDPTWYAPAQLFTTWTYSINDELSFPTKGFPVEFGSDQISATQTLTYGGTWLCYPLVVFTGPLVSPQIENVSTGKKLKLDYTLPAGKSVTIDCRYGYKTVLQNDGVNLISYLSSDSDLDFYIAADPEVADGENEFFASGGSAVAGQSSIQLQYYERFIGV